MRYEGAPESFSFHSTQARHAGYRCVRLAAGCDRMHTDGRWRTHRNASPTPAYTAPQTPSATVILMENTLHTPIRRNNALSLLLHMIAARRAWMRDRWPDAPCCDDSDDVLRCILSRWPPRCTRRARSRHREHDSCSHDFASASTAHCPEGGACYKGQSS